MIQIHEMTLLDLNQISSILTSQFDDFWNENLLKNGTGDNNEGAGGLNKCLGFVDVNGTALPNKEVKCHGDDGEEATTKLDPSSPCTVTSEGSEIGDIFPIVFHDGTVEPASNAAKAVLTRGK